MRDAVTGGDVAEVVTNALARGEVACGEVAEVVAGGEVTCGEVAEVVAGGEMATAEVGGDGCQG
ncbi:hypothetical protein EV643_13744 [Kribbella sp. VKM Ac-2527]|uniref:Uncharacterized protein n=1 Tax=Kribbella caucasensis TaxID=2512215 RepID=A0A4R6J6C6_9ACTN|nr:hypothetical protein EV643_13744 [Kribbella sp. VKM Ac-2527]